MDIVSGLQLSRRGGALPAYQQLLNLASADGWTAVYDPTNPNTRTLRESGGSTFVTQIEDGLGNLPALVQATEANQPEFLSGAFGKLDALLFDGSNDQLTCEIDFGTDISVVMLVRPLVAILDGGAFGLGPSSPNRTVCYPNDPVEGTGGIRIFTDGIGSWVTEDTTDQSGLDQVVSFRSKSGQRDARRNGTEVGSSTAEGNISPTELYWGSGAHNNQHTNFRCAALVLKDARVSDAVLVAMEDKLTALGGVL